MKFIEPEQHLSLRELAVLARDPETNPDRLIWLLDGELGNWDTPRALAILPLIARNPNTPLATLTVLASYYPMAVLGNPEVALAHLENPLFSLWGETPVDELARVVRDRAVPDEVVLKIITPRLGAQIEVVRRLLGAALCREHLLPQLIIPAFNSSSGVRRRLAAHRQCPKEVLARLAWDLTLKARAGVALNPEAPDNLLLLLLEDPASTILIAFLGRRAPLSPRVWSRLALKCCPQEAYFA